MEPPVFEEIAPADDCDCAGCLQWRGAVPHPVRTRIGARHALVVAAAAGTVVGGLQLTPAVAAEHHEERPDDPGPGDGSATPAPTSTPQGGTGPLHGTPEPEPTVQQAQQSTEPAEATEATDGPEDTDAPEGAEGRTTRAAIIQRAQTWVEAKVPYAMNKYWKDGYRQDCSGYVSMAWGLPGNEWTGSLAKFATRITKAGLEPGDILLFHNPKNPEKGSHVTIFGGWTDHTRNSYFAYEQTRPGARRQSTPYAYWTNSSRYVPYRYKGVGAGGAAGAQAPGPAPATRFPGATSFGPGAENTYVTRLGELLVERGGKRFYRQGPGPRWSEADRRATAAFQRAQGWSGRDADGLPGPTTWSYLLTGEGRDIPAASAGDAPAFPGAAKFRPGAQNAAVTQLGRQLVKKGFGKHYAKGPGPRWSEADRRNVEAFQRAQGWRGRSADGYPGPETWRRLFS
ncbi:peptidoglycan-binding protein [Streptomyces sp. NPDC006552]|uniref:peptidoglycan-binding protein n=1 Tax=Streptomyces sp. NPDC006552 TaxID=3157179 RepID=UPI0033B6B538